MHGWARGDADANLGWHTTKSIDDSSSLSSPSQHPLDLCVFAGLPKATAMKVMKVPGWNRALKLGKFNNILRSSNYSCNYNIGGIFIL